MWLKSTANAVEHGLSPVMSVIGKIGSAVIAFIMLLTVADVIGRRAFNAPVPGAYEINGLMLVVVIFFTMAHCQFLKGHVTIDLLVSRMKQRQQDIIDSFLYLLFLATFALITRQLWLHGLKLWHDNVTSGTIGLAVYPFAFVAAFGAALLCVIIFVHLLLFLSRAVGR